MEIFHFVASFDAKLNIFFSWYFNLKIQKTFVSAHPILEFNMQQEEFIKGNNVVFEGKRNFMLKSIHENAFHVPLQKPVYGLWK